MKRIIVITFLLFTMLLSFTSVASVARVHSVPLLSGVLPGVTSGSSYAAALKVPAGSNIGPLFSVALGCNTSTKTLTSASTSMSLGTYASSDTLLDRVISTRTSTLATVDSSAALQNVNVLSGLITADAINAVVETNADSSTALSVNNLTFTNLIVASTPVVGTPAPNTIVALPGLGQVTLNEQIGLLNTINKSHVTVNALDISVTTTNTYGLPIGTHITVGHVTLRTPSRAAASHPYE